ncbi:MAG TPA: adenylate/guanylate cyclase domain-containing protein [Ferrovibrio sp.]|uniref:adenylate/guanylate cyclase domain-containing protein n=1 Tax=Ferrovibrio sp. TaxID=1917215 RepID=UPI002B4B625D|nr:adenylate/guanylate cyclase domain-containing protein [Ferrovibrio sp.]HLT77375.1 adenylate/guanylate cyclase domain-containing protein [Ferrovibrio sp.]
MTVHIPALAADAPLDQWLVAAGLDGLPVDQLVDGFATRLNAEGIPVGRAYVAIATLHPLVRARGATWFVGQGVTELAEMPHRDIGEVPQGWHDSPFRHMLEHHIFSMRRRLAGPGAQLDFPVLREFAEAGYTDWLSLAYSFGWDLQNSELENSHVGIGMISSLATTRPEGFSEAELVRLRGLVPLLALALKGATLTQIARDVTASYIGGNAATHVLSGEIRRGDAKRIDAVMLCADLRGFTSMADRLAIEPLVETLNAYFDCVGPAIAANGGEVLKFLGDGLLASFHLGEGRDPAPVCAAALQAAEEALRCIAVLNEQRRAAGLPVLELDIALHRGMVMYGNVGTGTRLDFTLIGPAVNEVSRLESLCAVLGCNLLASASFAAAAGPAAARLSSLGRHELRGVAEPQEVFGLSR